MGEGSTGERIDVQQVVELLERLGYRLTPQRILVTKIILENVKRHPSFKEIHQMASKHLPRLGVSTTYTIMKMLEEAGVITTFEVDGDTHIDSPEPHINVVCEDTGEIFDLDDEKQLVNMLVETLRRRGIGAENPILIVKTRCKDSWQN